MTEERSERRLRDWFAAVPAVEEPPSLHAFLAGLPTTHPQRSENRRSAGRSRLGLVAAAVVAVVAATALAVVGARLLDTSPGPSAAPASDRTSPSPSARSSTVGAALRIGERTGSGASMAVTAAGPIVVISSVPASALTGAAGGPGASTGATCPASVIGSVGAGSIDWTATAGAIVEVAGNPGSLGPIGLGLSTDCAQPTVAVPDGSGGLTMVAAPNPLRPDAAFFGIDPRDSRSVAAWFTDVRKGKGGFLSWSGDGGRSWQSLTGSRSIGWDGSGAFWSLAADGGLLRSQGPGFSDARTGAVFTVTTTTDGQAADVLAATVFRDRVLVAPVSGGLQTAATTGSAAPVRGLDLRVVDLSANARYVAAVGLDPTTEQPILAISNDGQRFTTTALPAEYATATGIASVRVLALDDRILLTDGGRDGVIGVWSVAVIGRQDAPPPPTPAPNATIPSAPPARATSIWTLVSPPSSRSTDTVGGSGGGITALPGGGFLDFVPVSGERTLVFRSSDGSDWAQTGEITGRDASGIVPAVAFDGTRYVAIGHESGGQFYGDQSNGAAWVSTDLRRWMKAPVQRSFGGAEFAGLTAGPDRFIAIGFDNGGQAVWTSPDGLAWTTVSDARAMPPGSTFPSAIVHRASGFVMVGRLEQEAAVWTSGDGRRWTLESSLPGGSGVGLLGLADGGRGLVTFGLGDRSVEVTPGDFRGPVMPWMSDDGSSWQAGPPSPALFGAYATIVAVADGYVTMGTVGLEPEVRLWTSTDGLDWTQVAGVDLAGVGTAQLVSDGHHVLLAGSGDHGPLMLVSGRIDP